LKFCPHWPAEFEVAVDYEMERGIIRQVRKLHLKRAATIVGRFAFGGWMLVTGILLIVACIAGVAGLPGLPGLTNPFYSVFILLRDCIESFALFRN